MSVVYSPIRAEEIKSISDDMNINSINPINRPKLKRVNLYIRPISDIEKNDEKINKLIYSSLNDPAQFFSELSPVHIGARIKLQHLDLSPQKEKRKISYLARLNSRKPNQSFKASVTDTSKSLYTIKEKLNQKSLIQNQEIIDNNYLKRIFEGYKEKIYKNKNKRNKENNFSHSVKNLNKNYSISKTIQNEDQFPSDLYNSLSYQNKRINDELNYIKRTKIISKMLSKKTNKNEIDLLFNKVDLFKYKKEILSKADKDRIPEKYIFDNNLRLPFNYKGKKEFHINVNNDRNPFWGVLIEKNPKNKELSVKPGYNLNQKEFLKFSQDMNSVNKNKDNVSCIKNLDDLKVEGSDLLSVEYKREMSTKGRKILYKAFVENGKLILNQDINTVFGEQTLYKNYENKNKNNYSTNEYLKGNKSEKSIFMNSLTERNENNSSLFNYQQTIPSKL